MFLSQKTKILNDTILDNYNRFVLPENQLILPKTVKKISEESFFKEKYGSGGWNQISLISYNKGCTCRSQKRFSLFYSSSKALSNDVSLSLNYKLHLTDFGDVSLCDVTI